MVAHTEPSATKMEVRIGSVVAAALHFMFDRASAPTHGEGCHPVGWWGLADGRNNREGAIKTLDRKWGHHVPHACDLCD